MDLDRLRVVPLRADDDDLIDRVAPLREAITQADSPWNVPATRRQFVAGLVHGWDGEPGRLWIGLDGDQPVAFGGLGASTHDNLDHAWLDVSVHPDRRREGIGSAMLGHLEAVAAAEERPKVGLGGWESDAAGGFAAHHGYAWASQAIQRRQRLDALPASWSDDLAAAATERAADYELLAIQGAMPDDLAEPIIALWGDINDAPTDDLDIEDEVFSADRIRGYERAQEAYGNRMHHLVARHRDSGELGGHTIVVVEEERPHRAHQHDTTVAKAHRGHRLGLVLKATMMARLLEHEPQVRTVDTWNAESNSFMISVNEQLGYRPVGRSVSYQRTLGV